MNENNDLKINTLVVKKVKVNGVYQVHNKDLNINSTHGFRHDVIVTSINRFKKTATVKTITSLERRSNNSYKFINPKLDDVREGNILVIPKNQLKSSHLSGINQRSIIVPLKCIHYKENHDRTIYPKRYKKMINKK